MGMLDDGRRWLKDQFSHDEHIAQKPSEPLREIEANIAQMTATERMRSVEHIKAYADLYYIGRHNEPIPPDMRERLRSLERQAENLNRVDQARATLERLGGPPSRETVQDAVQRSFKERSLEYQKASASKAPKTSHKEHVREHVAEP